MVEAFPEVPVGQINVLYCVNENFDPFSYEGNVYFQSGIYPLIYPGLSLNGCDSFAELNLTIEGLDLFVELICYEGQNYLIPHPIQIIPNKDTITFEWYDCNFSNLLSNESNLSISTPGCFCVIADNGFCKDTFCSNYLTNPCEFSCSIVQDQACRSENVVFSYNGNASPNASFHWLIDLPSQPGVYFTGNDTVILQYDTTGCYHASLTIVDDTSTVTCLDSVCIISGAAQASICCDQVICSGCATIVIDYIGANPWTVVISDGNKTDTIGGLVTPSYSFDVCPDTTTTYSIVEVFGFEDQCPGTILGDGKTKIDFYTPSIPVISQSGSMICAPDGMVSYSWHECAGSEVLSNSQCFIPIQGVCFCVDVVPIEGCMASACIDITDGINSLSKGSDILLFPNPTTGELNVQLSENILLPVNWNLYDPEGIEQQNGYINSTSTTLHLTGLSSGLYFLKFKSCNGKTGIYKITITID